MNRRVVLKDCKYLLIPLLSFDGGENGFQSLQPEFPGKSYHSLDDLCPLSLIPYDPSTTNLTFADFKLRLDQGDDLALRSEKLRDGRKDFRQRDK